MQNVALYWLILSLTHSPLAVGFLSLARFGPFTILGLFAGVVADRFDNRRTVIVTQSVQMVFSGVLAAVMLLGTVQVWQVYAIAALHRHRGRLRPPRPPEPHVQLVGRDELPNAIALNSSLFNTARILGPALAGRRDRRGRLRLVLRDQQRQLPRRARRACSRCGSASSTR